LEELSGPAAVEALAYHFERGEAPDRAVVYLELAADKARAQQAHETAVGYYRALIGRLDDMHRPGAMAAACEKLGTVLTTLAQYEEALAVLERAAVYHAGAGELEGLGRITAQIGYVLGQTGAPHEGLARLRPLLEAIEARGPSPALVDLYTTQSRLYLLLFLPQEELAAATRALELARALHDDALVAKAVVKQGYALIAAGRVAESLEALDEARRLAESLGDLSCLHLAHFYASTGHYALGDLRASVRCAEMALDIARRLGDPEAITSAVSYRSRSAFLMGDWSRARTDLEGIMARVPHSRTILAIIETSVFLGECYLAAGAWDEASRYLHEVVARSTWVHGRVRHAQGLLAELDLYHGRLEAARDRLLPLHDAENTFATWLRTQLAWAYLDLGEVRRAAELVSRAIAQARSEKHLIRLVDALRIQAMVLARQGQADQAAAALDEGLTLAPAMPYPYGEARLLHVYGLLHKQRGEPQLARTRLEAALAIFRRLGARKDLERIEQVLATLT
jgi:tetratricopeptide (TPR) repeat protein